MEKAKFGVVGLGVMGQNLALNLANKGYPVAVFNRTTSKTEAFISGPAKEKEIIPTYDYPGLIDALERPRRILLMVKAGPAVDGVIDQIKPFLDSGDILIDGGNSFFEDTERRNRDLKKEGFMFIGAGISGGEEGALHGPSIMPGGNWEAWKAIEPMFRAAAAKAEDGESCVDYMGPRGAGHYVKMVHNGIEYAIMQLIAEAYDILHRGIMMEAEEMGALFATWNAGNLSSYLIEITAEILKTMDPKTGKPILDVILDEAKQKGTGKWTSQNAFDLGSPSHIINAAVTSRVISGMKEQRVEASKIIKGPEPKYSGDRQQLIDAVEEALYAAVILAYTQGFELMTLASQEYDYNLDMRTVAKIWRAGCIIRANLLDDIMRAFEQDKRLSNLIFDEDFRKQIVPRQGAMRYVITKAVGMGIPAYAFSAALGYFDALRTERLPANMTQAQRDYFGAHTYRRLDIEGTFHTDWMT